MFWSRKRARRAFSGRHWLPGGDPGQAERPLALLGAGDDPVPLRRGAARCRRIPY